MVINNTPFTASAEEIIDELKRQLTINKINLLNSIRDTPENIMVSCPYHKNGQERRPSAGIKKSDGTFHCFACGEVHTLPEVISYCFGNVDEFGNFGWNWLLKNFVSISVEERKPLDLQFNRKKITVAPKNFIGEQELDSYRYTHQYMYKRKLTDEIIELFDIGYDKDTECITFPVRDVNGNCLFVARRSVNTKFFNYPQGAEKPLYGLYELNATRSVNGHPVHILPNFPNEIIICESMIDALTCWVYGKYAVALNGLGNDLQFKQLRELPCRKYILATDNDSAGMKARKRIRNNVRNKLITEYKFPPNRKDINDLTKEEFDNLIELF